MQPYHRHQGDDSGEAAEWIYSPNGKKLNKLQKGLNIVMMRNGTIRKIVIK